MVVSTVFRPCHASAQTTMAVSNNCWAVASRRSVSGVILTATPARNFTRITVRLSMQSLRVPMNAIKWCVNTVAPASTTRMALSSAMIRQFPIPRWATRIFVTATVRSPFATLNDRVVVGHHQLEVRSEWEAVTFWRKHSC